MLRRRIATIAATALLCAAPGSALAQSAGDDQYVDPLGGSSPSGGGSGGGGGSAGGSDSAGGAGAGSASGSAAGAGTGAGAGTAGEQAAPAEGQATAAPRRPELARTGFPAGIAAGAGALMLGAGAGLRRALRERD